MKNTLNLETVLFMLERLLMQELKPLVFQASLALLDLLCLSFTKPDQFLSKQEFILHSTILLLRLIQLFLYSESEKQQQISRSCLEYQIVGNNAACSMMKRIFPKSLRRKISFAEKGCIEWKIENWKEFFNLVKENFDTATEQWNEDCREELYAKLSTVIDNFLKSKISLGENKVIFNAEEFRVKYSTLESKCKVGRYYLSNLISFTELGLPKLVDSLTDPNSFWRGLNNKLTVTKKIDQMILIVQTMHAVYEEYVIIIITI